MSGVRFADGFFDDAWTQVPRGMLRDPALSWKAKGLVAWLCSHGEGFKFTRSYIVTASVDGKDAVETGLRELREAGYLTVEQARDDAGRLAEGSDYVLHRTVTRISRTTDNPESGESAPKKDQVKERAVKDSAPDGARPASASPSGPSLHGVSPVDVAPLTLNQRATRLAQNHYERLGKMGNVPAIMKIIRKALEHEYTDAQVDAACAHVAEHRWTLTEERLANTLRGGPKLPSGPPRINGARPTARTASGMEIQL